MIASPWLPLGSKWIPSVTPSDIKGGHQSSSSRDRRQWENDSRRSKYERTL